MQSQLENLNVLYQQQQGQASYYQNYCSQWQAYQVGQTPDPNQVLATLQAQHSEMEQQLAYGWQAFEQQSSQLAAVSAEKTALQEESARLIDKATSKASEELRERVSGLERDLSLTKKEQEDLLVLLADQDAKIRDYRLRLVKAGQEVSEDEEENDEEQLR